MRMALAVKKVQRQSETEKSLLVFWSTKYSGFSV